MVKFTGELRSVNEQVALDFDRQKNPAEHDLAERKQMLEAAEQGFEPTAWKDAWERRKTWLRESSSQGTVESRSPRRRPSTS